MNLLTDEDLKGLLGDFSLARGSPAGEEMEVDPLVPGTGRNEKKQQER